MHFVLSCYLQCTLWGGETQQTLKAERVIAVPGQSSHIRHQGCATGLGDGSGAEIHQKATSPLARAARQWQTPTVGTELEVHQGLAPQHKVCPASLPLAPCEAHCQLLHSGSWGHWVPGHLVAVWVR